MLRRRMPVMLGLLFVAVFLISSLPSGAKDAPSIKVMSYNIWGIIGAEERELRTYAIGRKIAELDPQVVAVQEAFEKKHRDILFQALTDKGYEFEDSRYFSYRYGSGVLLISKFPVDEVLFEPYRVNAPWQDIERLGGKGVAYARLKTPWGPLDFFLTHVIARMTPLTDSSGEYVPHDPKKNDRLIQLYQLDRFVRDQRSAFGRSVIAAGDFNVSPQMLEYKFLVYLTGLVNSFDKANPGKNPSTYSADNMYATGEYHRIDHIFYKNYRGSRGFWLEPAKSRIVMTDGFSHPETMETIDYSDHYGVMTEFRVIKEPAAAELSPPGVSPLPCFEKVCLHAYDKEVIRLDQDNLERWQSFACRVFARAFREKDRENPLIPPMARVVAMDKDAMPAKVRIPADAADELMVEMAGTCGGRETPFK
ncbi:MAG: endonuclease/exonuclease/phosphatase family protein [bacterium]